MQRKLFPDPVLRRYAEIDLEGRNTIKNKPEEIEGVPPYSEEYKSRFHTSLLFLPESIKSFRERVIDRIVEIAARLGIELMVAGRDYSVHSTLKDGYYQDKDDTARNEAFNRSREDADFDAMSESVEGQTVEYKYLLIDKGNVLLTCPDIPETVKD